MFVTIILPGPLPEKKPKWWAQSWWPASFAGVQLSVAVGGHQGQNEGCKGDGCLHFAISCLDSGKLRHWSMLSWGPHFIPKMVKMFPNPRWATDQCDQIKLFLNDVNEICHKNKPNIWLKFELFWKSNFLSKNCCGFFLANVWGGNWATFRSDCLVTLSHVYTREFSLTIARVSMTDLQFDWLGFYQTWKSVDNFYLTKLLNPNLWNRRSAIQWFFPYKWGTAASTFVYFT